MGFKYTQLCSRAHSFNYLVTAAKWEVLLYLLHTGVKLLPQRSPLGALSGRAAAEWEGSAGAATQNPGAAHRSQLPRASAGGRIP